MKAIDLTAKQINDCKARITSLYAEIEKLEDIKNKASKTNSE